MHTTKDEFDLSEWKAYFEEQIQNTRIVSDITLSESNFKLLGIKLKELFSLPNAEDAMNNLMICYLVYWVHVLIYWKEESGIHDELTDFCFNLPQYQARHHLMLLMDTIANYNIYDFGYNRERYEDYCSMVIARHVGIPFDEQFLVFDLIDDYRNQDKPIDTMIEDLYLELPYKSRYLFSLLDPNSRNHIIWEIRFVMAEVASRSYKKEELLYKYPRISARLIDSCFSWYESKKVL